jgi:peptidoglycan/xylan/chitin deacetylase (PgdA/CDA1 family)
MHWRLQKIIDSAHDWALTSFSRRELAVASNRPIISFTFDDFPRSAFAAGGRVLEDYGVRGTYYAAIGLKESDSKMGPLFGVGDLERLADKGHELGCHTFDHLAARSAATHEYEQSIRKNQIELAAILPSYRFSSFAFPFGSVTLGAKKMCGRLFACCRGARAGINSGTIDLNLLCAVKLYSTKSGAAFIDRMIEQNQQVNGWLIFYTHDVQANPSPYGCSTADLERVLKKSLQSGAAVLPVRDALTFLKRPDAWTEQKASP